MQIEKFNAPSNLNNAPNLLGAIAQLIEQAQRYVVVNVNTTMVTLYWQIGKMIQEDIVKSDRAEYGRALLENLGKELTVSFGRGYSRQNLNRMVDFFRHCPDIEICSTVSSKLSWSQIQVLMRIKDGVKREFYLTMSVNEHWSVRQLSERIDSQLFERTAISKKPEETIINDLKTLREDGKMTLDLFLKDPVMLDFLNLKDCYSEKDLEQVIVRELENFILEMGRDFAFLARQKRITVGREDYYLDLLFFHRKLKRLVAIELKLDEFKHSYKSQMELYLRWLDKYERNEDEETPIGLLLCSGKDDELVDLLSLNETGIHVVTYMTELPPKELLLAKLQQAIKTAKLKLKTK
jgi:predicted nuclease of restriction endonuclease-like (RecB) superfamily